MERIKVYGTVEVGMGEIPPVAYFKDAQEASKLKERKEGQQISMIVQEVIINLFDTCEEYDKFIEHNKILNDLNRIDTSEKRLLIEEGIIDYDAIMSKYKEVVSKVGPISAYELIGVPYEIRYPDVTLIASEIEAKKCFANTISKTVVNIFETFDEYDKFTKDIKIQRALNKFQNIELFRKQGFLTY